MEKESNRQSRVKRGTGRVVAETPWLMECEMVTYLCAIPSPTECCGLFFITRSGWLSRE